MQFSDCIFGLYRHGISVLSSRGANAAYKLLRSLGTGKSALPDYATAHAYLDDLSPRPAKSLPNSKFRHSESIDISVIVPSYNAERYIDDCLGSILAQEGDFSMEVVVVNDGSTDETRERVISHALLDSRVRLVDQENRGFSGARNTGIDESRGKALVFVDSDDMLAPGHLSVLFSDFSRGGADFVSGSWSRMSLSGDVLGKGEEHRTHGAPWGRVYARRVWDRLRFPEGFWFEDTVQAFCIDTQWKGREVSDWGYLYRNNPASITNTACGSYKSLDSLWIAEELLDWCRYLEVPFGERLLNALVYQLGPITLGRNNLLDSYGRRCLFACASELLRATEELDDVHNTVDGLGWRDVERSLRAGDFRLWLLSCLWLS